MKNPRDMSWGDLITLITPRYDYNPPEEVKKEIARRLDKKNCASILDDEGKLAETLDICRREV